MAGPVRRPPHPSPTTAAQIKVDAAGPEVSRQVQLYRIASGRKDVARGNHHLDAAIVAAKTLTDAVAALPRLAVPTPPVPAPPITPH